MQSSQKPYTPANWYWQIGGDSTRWWSSGDAAYTTTLPEDAPFSAIDSEASLRDVLANVGLAQRAPGYVAPPPACALWQLEAVLTPAQVAAVEAAIAAMNSPAISAFWKNGTNVIPANSATLLALGAALGLTEAQVTSMVTAAALVAIP